MNNKVNKKIISLEEQYKQDCERRINNTIKLLKEFAENEMEGQEKEDFLKDLNEIKKDSN